MNRRATSPRAPQYLPVTSAEFDVLMRHDLATFVARTFVHVDPTTPFAHNWHLDLIADRLTQVYEGRLRRLIITVPPRSLKSICASVAFPAWVLGKDPSRRIICASYGQELSNKLARDTASVMQSPWYQRVFATRLAGRTATADFETTQKGGRMATSVGGVLTGRGGDILIIDDPVKPDEALSDVQRQAANDWFDHTLYTRLNDKQTGAIVLIMQRLHLDDLVGHVLEKEDWEIVNLPAIAHEDETWHYRTLLGEQTYQRKIGGLLHPGREPRAVLDQIQSTLGTYAFSAQYLQAPVPLGGGLVKQDWLLRYEPEDLPEAFDAIVQSWDTAIKESQLADYSVCTTWGVSNKVFYLLDVYRKRMEYPELKRQVLRLAQGWKAQTVLVEDKASGSQLIQELRSQLHGIKGIKLEGGDKVMRMHAQTATIENGKVRIPREAPWLADYIYELITFSKSKYDDQVDSTSQALRWLTVEGMEPSIFTYYKHEIAKSRGITIADVNGMLRKGRLVR